ncbi:MAG TPA: efflux RND transporter periplasmic adaptor subunit [Terracidiphilus sp.]|jgi:multidrug efflux pump subunit AcrA (membrane-fusion protein)
MRRSRIRILALIAALVLVVAAVIAMGRSRTLTSSDEIPVAEVKQGDLNIEVHATGELSASHSVMLVAPTIGGDALQITKLVQTGYPVKKGDVVVEFDPSEQRYKLEQSHSELLQAQEEITKAKADAQVQTAEDKVALLKARYNVRRAELDVEKNELVSKIDGQKNELTLQEAKRALAELEKDIESHHDSGQASIYLAQEKSNKAKLAMDQAQQNLDRMHVIATMDGLVSIQRNMNASGGFFFSGMSLPDYRPGDQVQPGSPIAEVLDPTEMNLTARVPETDRDNVSAGEAVSVRFNALPGNAIQGTVKTVGGMSMQAFFSSESSHGFDVTIQLAEKDSRLRPGLTAEVTFKGLPRKSVLYVPRQALFMKDGKRVVYVREGSSFKQREVKVEGQSESRAIISDLPVGTDVALLDPTVPRKTTHSSSSSGMAGAP